MAQASDRSKMETRAITVAGGLLGLLFAVLLATVLELEAAVPAPILLVAVLGAVVAGAFVGRVLEGVAGKVARDAGRVWTTLAFAISGGFVGLVAGNLLGPTTGESWDGSHIKTATLGVLFAGFGWFAGVAVAMVLTRGTVPPSMSSAWVLRAVALGFLIAGLVVARWVPSLDNPPPDTTLIPLQGAIRLDAVLAAATCLVLAQRQILRRTAVALWLVASVVILAVVAGRFPVRAVYVRDLTAVGGTLFFTVDSPSSGFELWKSDGTAAGTALVKDIDEVPPGSHIAELTEAGGILFFAAYDEAGGGLWKSDGTDAGTVLVKDTGREPEGLQLTEVGGALFFKTGDGVSGTQLWKTDATETGIVLVKEFDTRLSALRNVGGTVVFRVFGPQADSHLDSHLWTSDGTEAGTGVVSDQLGGGRRDRRGSMNIGGTVFFAARGESSGGELWKSDGTEAGTVLVKDTYPGRRSSRPIDLMNVGGTLFFRARDTVGGYGLWRSDGTEAGTVLVMSFDPRRGVSRRINLTDVVGTLLFGNGGDLGGELWSSDGTEAGALLVKEVTLGGPWEGGFGPSELTTVGGTLFFVTSDGCSGVELWASDGTEDGTVPVRRWPQRGLIGRLVG